MNVREREERIVVGIDRQLSARIERGEMDPSKMILSGKFLLVHLKLHLSSGRKS